MQDFALDIDAIGDVIHRLSHAIGRLDTITGRGRLADTVSSAPSPDHAFQENVSFFDGQPGALVPVVKRYMTNVEWLRGTLNSTVTALTGQDHASAWGLGVVTAPAPGGQRLHNRGVGENRTIATPMRFRGAPPDVTYQAPVIVEGSWELESLLSAFASNDAAASALATCWADCAQILEAASSDVRQAAAVLDAATSGEAFAAAVEAFHEVAAEGITIADNSRLMVRAANEFPSVIRDNASALSDIKAMLLEMEAEATDPDDPVTREEIKKAEREAVSRWASSTLNPSLDAVRPVVTNFGVGHSSRRGGAELTIRAVDLVSASGTAHGLGYERSSAGIAAVTAFAQGQGHAGGFDAVVDHGAPGGGLDAAMSAAESHIQVAAAPVSPVLVTGGGAVGTTTLAGVGGVAGMGQLGAPAGAGAAGQLGPGAPLGALQLARAVAQPGGATAPAGGAGGRGTSAVKSAPNGPLAVPGATGQSGRGGGVAAPSPLRSTGAHRAGLAGAPGAHSVRAGMLPTPLQRSGEGGRHARVATGERLLGGRPTASMGSSVHDRAGLGAPVGASSGQGARLQEGGSGRHAAAATGSRGAFAGRGGIGAGGGLGSSGTGAGSGFGAGLGSGATGPAGTPTGGAGAGLGSVATGSVAGSGIPAGGAGESQRSTPAGGTARPSLTGMMSAPATAAAADVNPAATKGTAGTGQPGAAGMAGAGARGKSARRKKPVRVENNAVNREYFTRLVLGKGARTVRALLQR